MDKPTLRQSRIQLNQHSFNSRTRRMALLLKTTSYMALLLCIWIWVVLLTTGDLTIGGVPAPIIVSFLQDEVARDAYFQGDGKKLHARLEEMGVEEKIKAYYRRQIPDETQLDQHIHQILYDRTGYVGDAYRVNSQGILVLKN